MSFSNDFNAQWLSFSNYLVSGMVIDSTKANTDLYESLSSVYKNEILRWSLEGQYNAQWLDELRKADSAVADQFNEELQNFRFQRAEVKKSKNILGFALFGGGAVVGIGVGLMLKWGTLPIAGAGTVMALIGGVVGNRISENKSKAVIDSEIDVYTIQLKNLGEKLLNIVKQADGKEPIGM